MHDRSVHCVVSKPGPAERALLERLSSSYVVAPKICGGVVLRTILSRDAPSEGRGDGCILLVHGRGHAASLWSPWLSAWAGKRRVIAVDLPGFGHSASPPLPRQPSAEQGLDFFVDPIAELAAELEPCAIVGHSLGGLVALETVLRKRCRPSKLVLIDAMGLGPVVLPAARLYLRAGPERLARLGLGRLGPSASADGELAALRAELAHVRGGRPEAKRAFDAMLPLWSEPLNRRGRLAEVGCDTLLLWGERDEAFPLTTAIDAVTRLPRARLVALPAGHSPHFELEARTRLEVERFLDEAADAPDGSPPEDRIA